MVVGVLLLMGLVTFRLKKEEIDEWAFEWLGVVGFNWWKGGGSRELTDGSECEKSVTDGGWGIVDSKGYFKLFKIKTRLKHPCGQVVERYLENGNDLGVEPDMLVFSFIIQFIVEWYVVNSWRFQWCK